ncbi:nitroreductase family protein [Aquihabitans daechungensis]|uniref:nitroreductase family protein n=1 Tax=Aquihabitans daechungensis TaxID=1052257 RepID=UPI003BA1944B
MELNDAIRSRRMVRSFTDEPVDGARLEALCDLARRAPSAGNSQGLDLVVLAGPEEVGAYWDVTLPAPRRESFRWPGLVAAPALVLVVTDPSAYVERYGEDDKAATGLGKGPASWPVPYWWVDAGAAIEHLLLGAVDAGLGACLFGLFDHEAAVAEAFGVPAGRRIVGSVAVGHPAVDAPGRSSSRPRRPLDDVVHRGRW